MKDPLLYLGLFSFILFSAISFGANFILKPGSQQENNPFLATVSKVFYQPSSQSLFTLPKTKGTSFDFNIIQQNSLIGVAPPNTISFQVLGSLVGDQEEVLSEDNQSNSGSKEIIEYIVQDGDTLSSISEKFGISVETILWANDLNKKSVIKPGQKLIILPVSGVLHYVKKGDTLSEIAKLYQAKISEIVAFNELSSEKDIYIGDILIIPNGIKPQEKISSQSISLPQTPLASSYFIVPVSSPYIITQGLHWYNAVDFSHIGGSCGKPVFAAAGGEVVKAKYGWNGGAGNNVSILHPNGVVTVYYHLQTILVEPGQQVSAGTQIGTIGNTGITTGCHLHFGVLGAKNPFAQ